MTLSEWVRAVDGPDRREREAFETTLLEAAAIMEQLRSSLPPPFDPLHVFRVERTPETWAQLYQGWQLFNPSHG